MKHVYLILLLFASINSYGQPWVQKASLPVTDGLSGCFSFSTNGKLYVGGGYDNVIANVVNGFYEYDPATDTWTIKASVPIAVGTYDGFILNGYAYIACGSVSGNTPSNYVYKYDTAANTWTAMNNFPGSSRQNHRCFTLNGYGYMFGGFAGGATINEMWEYNPTTDSWVQKASPPLPSVGSGRNGPAYLVINNQAYVGLGGTSNGSNTFSDFYLFDPGTIGVAGSGSYTQVASIPVDRECSAMFTIGNFGYIGIGWQGGNGYLDDFWKYDPVANTWTQVCNFSGGARQHPFGTAVNGSPYVGTGDFSGGNYKDMWTWAVCNFNVNLGNDTAICSGETITLRDTFSNASSLWSTGDTTASITVSTNGTYWLRVTQTNCTSCTGSDTINITVINPPAPFSLGNDTTYCGSFTRALSTGNTNTLWSSGVTASQITVTSPGTYWAEISNPCGTVRDTIVISQNPLPMINLGNDTNICNSNPITLNATTTAATYLWQNGTTDSTLTISTSGIYWVDVTVNGCMKRDSIAVSYISPLSFDIGDDTTYCGNFDRILTAGVANTIWSTGDTATSIIINSQGLYWAYAVACGDTFRDSINILEESLPIVNIGNDTSVCPNDDVILNAGNPGASYLWVNNTTGQTLVVNAPGTYWVAVTVNGCTQRDSILISELSPPVPFTIGNDTTICEDSVLILDAYQSGVEYFWSTGDTTSLIAVTQSGQYQVMDSNICGSYKASVSVTAKQCSCKIAIPTAFSPNGDGKNDFFYVVTLCPLENFQFNIYNRWGQEIFTTNDISDKWDGSYRGKQQPIGVYVYFLHYKDPYTGKDNSQTGDVTLLR